MPLSQLFLQKTVKKGSSHATYIKNRYRTNVRYLFLVRGMGFEPTRTNVRYPLKVVRLPVPPSSHLLNFVLSQNAYIL